MPQRAAIYLRISEDRSGEGLAVDRQREDCRALVYGRDWTVTREHVDNDISAAGRKSRPGFLALVADIRAGNVDVVVAWALDRLVRTPRDRLTLVEACRKAEVSVVLVRGSDMDLTTAAGRLYAGLLGEVAQHELDVRSERQIRQSKQAAEAGRPGGGPRAFGYRKGGMEIDPTEAPVVADLYHRFLAGAGLGELADLLNRARLTTPKGSKWRPGSVKVVLANPRNAGLRGFRPVEDDVTGRRAYWHEVIAPAMWPGIVEEATWRAATAVLRDPSRLLGPSRRDSGGAPFRHLLSGIATCGRRGCTMPMIASSSAGHRTYRCSSKMHIVRRAEPLDRFVSTAVMERLRRDDAVGLLLDSGGGDGEMEALQGAAVSARARLAGVATDYADKVLDRDQVKVYGDRIRAELAGIERRIAELGQVDVLSPIVMASDDEAAWTVWQAYPVSTQRAVIARLMTVVVLRGRVGRPPVGAVFDPDSVRIWWRGQGSA